MGMEIKRFEVYLTSLDPTLGKEINKTRPALVISPDVMNQHLSTIIIALLTSVIRNYPTRVNCEFQSVKGQIALDQVDKVRLVKSLEILMTILHLKL